MINKLRRHEFATRKLNEDEIKKVALAKFECEDCGKNIFEMCDFPETENIDKSNCLCEDCYENRYFSYCEVCQETYEKREDSKEYLIFSKTNEDEIDKIGIYKILKYPYFISDYFSATLIEENVKLVRECNIESMLKNIHNSETIIESADCICQTCAEKFAMITPLSWIYEDRFIKTNESIRIKEIIKRGF